MTMKTQIEPSKVQEAKRLWREILSLEKIMTEKAELVKIAAYKLGGIFCELKEEVGHGKWLLWICGNFPELGDTDTARIRRSQRCMDFYRRNTANTTDSSRINDIPDQWDAEAERKLMYGYVPAKQRAAIKGDEKDTPTVHHLTWVNNFHKWDRQIAIGLAEFPHISVLQHELEEPFRRIVEICGRDWALQILGEPAQTITTSCYSAFAKA